MIEAGEVSTLIVKDASRLGREYLQVGYYMEIYFPQKNVRFIAVNDGVDSVVESSNDFNPIRNWANELHAKDTSRKVRAVKKLQAERGEWLGGRPPYGYRKSETTENHLEPDPEAAEVVQQIFTLCAAGKGPSQIARILTERNILTPANYYFQKAGKTHKGCDALHPCTWSGTTVSDILKNVMYLGHTVGLRRTTISYKNKTRIDRPESEQCLVKTRTSRSSRRSSGRSCRRCGSTKSARQSTWMNRTSFPDWYSVQIAESQWCCIVPRP